MAWTSRNQSAGVQAVAVVVDQRMLGGQGWGGDIWGHPQIPLATGQTTPTLVHLTIMTLAGSTSDRAKASRADVEHPSMARRNRAGGRGRGRNRGLSLCAAHGTQGLPLRDRPLSGKSYEHRRAWIRDRLESLAGLFGVEIAAFAVM